MRNIAVIGAGQMGTGIAQTVAAHGMNVMLSDINLATAEAGLAKIEQAVTKLVGRGKLEADAAVLQAMFQPIREEAVLLGFFILLEHLVIGILVAGRYLAMGLEHAHLKHTGVVVGPDLYAQAPQPTRRRMLLVQVKDSGITTALYYLQANPRSAHIEFPQIGKLVVGKQPHQAGIIGFTDRVQLSQVHLELLFPCLSICL